MESTATESRTRRGTGDPVLTGAILSCLQSDRANPERADPAGDWRGYLRSMRCARASAPSATASARNSTTWPPMLPLSIIPEPCRQATHAWTAGPTEREAFGRWPGIGTGGSGLILGAGADVRWRPELSIHTVMASPGRCG